jgi:uncharacterized protein (TIGR02246 family)
MLRDEEAIRALIHEWIEATAAGDLARVLELMDDHVVFLGPGRPPMRGKEAFAAATRLVQGQSRIEGHVEIQEVQVFGDWAYCWNQLAVTARPEGGGEPRHLAGPAMSVLRKLATGKWVIFRDANMLAPAATPGDPR